MKTSHAILALAVLGAVGALLLWPSPGGDTPHPPAALLGAPAAAQRVVAPRPGDEDRRELTPQQVERRAGLAARDARATEMRRALFQSNLRSIDIAIENAAVEGANPEYVAALERRRELLTEQAEVESLALAEDATSAAASFAR